MSGGENGPNNARDWKVIAIAFLLGSSGGGVGHGLLTGAPAEDTARVEHKIDRLAQTVEQLAVTVRATDQRLGGVEAYQRYVVRPRLSDLHPGD